MSGTRKTASRVIVRALPDGLTQCHNPRCGVWFLPKRSDALFCSKACGIMDLRRRKAEIDPRYHAQP